MRNNISETAFHYRVYMILDIYAYTFNRICPLSSSEASTEAQTERTRAYVSDQQNVLCVRASMCMVVNMQAPFLLFLEVRKLLTAA